MPVENGGNLYAIVKSLWFIYGLDLETEETVHCKFLLEQFLMKAFKWQKFSTL